MKKSIKTLQKWLIRRLIYLLAMNLASVCVSIFVIYVLYEKTNPHSLQTFAGIAACLLVMNIAFNWLAVKRFKQLVCTDALTGLTTRRYLFERLEDYQKMLKQSPESSLAVLFIDVDNFGEINDYYGHITGDQVMKRIASLIENEIGVNDTAARFGEDTITILTMVKNHQESIAVANRICEAVRHTQFDYEDHPFNLTVSIGVSEITEIDNMNEAFEVADRYLQQAKKAGKDRVVA